MIFWNNLQPDCKETGLVWTLRVHIWLPLGKDKINYYLCKICGKGRPAAGLKTE